jgi:tungstate transport system ATP-binding protein
MVTHDVGQARRLADDVIFLDRGRVTEFQPATRFFSQPESLAGRAFIAGELIV